MPTALPSGRQHTIVFGDQQAVIVEVGAALRTYRVGEQDVLSGYPETEMPTSARGQVLIPWPNRLRDGQYTWDRTRHQLPLSEPAKHNAIHGLVRWANWTTGRQTTSDVQLRHVLHPQPGYPFTVELAVSYRLDETGLAVTTTATNLGSSPAPLAGGQHPYLAAPDLVDDCELQLDAATYLPTDDRGLPIGRDPSRAASTTSAAGGASARQSWMWRSRTWPATMTGAHGQCSRRLTAPHQRCGSTRPTATSSCSPVTASQTSRAGGGRSVSSR